MVLKYSKNLSDKYNSNTLVRQGRVINSMEDWNTGILEYWENVGINIFGVESFFALKRQMDLRNLELFQFIV